MVWWNKQSENPEERRMKAEHAKENLFLLLDDKMATHVGKLHFWRDLQALDDCIVPGSIRVEPYLANMFDGHDDENHAEEEFCKGHDTLVIGVTDKRVATRAVRLLNKIFAGCDAEFVLEAHSNGHETLQIRSNIDKQYWDKLAVFCQYRFAREVPQAEQRVLNDACQSRVSAYTEDTPYAEWKSLEGVPAFVTLMGLPGVLRPRSPEAPDVKRKQAEFDFPHPRGTPFLFDGIQVHVELKSNNQREITTTPYTYGFEPEKSAMRNATEGKSYWELLLETIGGNPFEKGIGWTYRAIAWVGLGLGFTGLTEVAGWLGSGATAGAVGTFVVATYVNHKWKIIERIEGIRKGSKELEALEKEYVQSRGLVLEVAPIAAQDMQNAPDKTPVEPVLCHPPLPLVEQVERMKTLGARGDSLQV